MASKYEAQVDDAEGEIGGLVGLLIFAIQAPLRILFSRSARRAYLTSFLLIIGGLVLLGAAVIAYILFYFSYIPRIGFERTVHLQFDEVYNHALITHNAHPYPYGNVLLTPDLVSNQQYDISVELTLPRTPDNAAVGNFMLEATMHAPIEKGGSNMKILDAVKDGFKRLEAAEPTNLATSRRPAILPYRSQAIDTINTMTSLPWYILGWRQQDEKLRISMFENVQFAKGWRNVPATMRVEIQSTHRMQIYAAKVHFRARFNGIRWMMYNHRIISALVFVNAFWVTEMVFAALTWAAFSMIIMQGSKEVKAEPGREGSAKIKQEDESEGILSDTERTFPSGVGQARLKYESPTIKSEEDEPSFIVPEANRGVEADDEDEDADFFDSGIGTSMDSSATRKDSVRRRRGRKDGRDGLDSSMFPS